MFIFGSQDSGGNNNKNSKQSSKLLSSKQSKSYLTEPPSVEEGKATISTLDAQTLIQVAINRINDQVASPASGIDGAHKIILVLFLFSGMMSIMFLGKCIHGANIKFRLLK